MMALLAFSAMGTEACIATGAWVIHNDHGKAATGLDGKQGIARRRSFRRFKPSDRIKLFVSMHHSHFSLVSRSVMS
jgi:hypothetical protein